MNIFYVLKLIYKRKFLWIVIPVLTSIVAFLFTANTEKTYKSTAQISTGYTITDQVKINDEGFNVYEINVKFDNLIETINSPMVYALLSYKLILHDLRAQQPFRTLNKKKEMDQNSFLFNDLTALEQLLQVKLQYMEMLSLFSEEDKMLLELLKAYGYDSQSLQKTISISRVRYTDYVSINSISENPELSAYLVNTLCEQFMRYYNSLKTQRSSESVKTFNSLVDQKKGELEEKSRALSAFKASSQVFDINLESSSNIERINEIEISLEEEKRKLRELLYSLSSIKKRLNAINSGGSILENSTNTEIVSLRNRITDLNETYILGGSQNVTLRDSIKNLRNELQVIITKAGSNSNINGTSSESLNQKKEELEGQVAMTKENIIEIENNLRVLKGTFGTYASKEARIAALEREVQLASEEYLNAQNKYNEALDVQIATTSTIKQVLYGQPALEAEPSKRILVIGLSYATSFVLCILAIVFLGFIDTSIKTPSYFTTNVPIRLITVVNHIKLKKNQGLNYIFTKTSDKKINNDVSVFIESIRKLRYEIEASNRKVIMVVSNNSGEGKSTLIQALSYLFSRSKKTILLIDTNFQNNYLTRTFYANPILEKLIGQNQIGNLKNNISKTHITGVDILGCKGGNYSPSEVFPGDSLKNAISSLTNKYDYIILEAAAINEFSAAKELIKSVDGLISIFSAKTSIGQNDKETINFLSNLDHKMIGAVLNDVEKENMEF